MVHVLPLLGHGGRVLPGVLALTGLQWVEVVLQIDGALGQRHVLRLTHVAVDVFFLDLWLFRIRMFAALCWRRHIDHFDVWDAGLPQGQLCVRQLQLLHVIDGYSGVEGLLCGEQGKAGVTFMPLIKTTFQIFCSERFKSAKQDKNTESEKSKKLKEKKIRLIDIF